MDKFYLVLNTRAAGMPQNVRIETSADTENVACRNALFLLRKHGHDVFNVNKRTFSPSLSKFNDYVTRDRQNAIQSVQPDDESWHRSVNLRAFIPAKDTH